MNRVLTVLVAALLALTLAACGDDGIDDEVDPRVAGALAHADFVDRGDRVCARGRDRLLATMHDFLGADPTDTQVAAWVETHALPILREQYEQLRALEPPPGAERRVERYLGLAEEGLAELEADPAALNRGDGLTPSLRRALDLGARLGFRECGQPIEREVPG